MSWPRAFLAVPTEQLVVDTDVSSVSPKASTADICRWVRNVPRIYDMLGRGVSDTEFFRMTVAPVSQQERELGETYRELFSTSASAHPLRAELGSDGRLHVTSGNHRVTAAQSESVPLLPVHVAAPDESSLDALRVDLEPQAESRVPNSTKVHRAHDARWREVRGNRAVPVFVEPPRILPEEQREERQR